MDPEKSKDCTDQTDNSNDVVTKPPCGSEPHDAIVYPSVFWTSCVSFGVALGLFLVRHRRVSWPVSTDNADNTILGRLGHGKCARAASAGCVGSVLGSKPQGMCLTATPNGSRQSSRPLFPRSPRTFLVSTSSAGTHQLFSSPWLAHSHSGMDPSLPLTVYIFATVGLVLC